MKVIVKGDLMTIDLSEVSPQVQGYFNSGATAGRSAAQVAFKCLTTPTQYPINDGAFRNLEIVLPPGRVISATKPAAVRWWMTIPMTVVDTIFRARAGVPDARRGPSRRSLRRADVRHQSADRPLFTSAPPTRRRLGREHDADGMNAVVCMNDGDTHNAVIEALEEKYPVAVERYALLPDSGGPGVPRRPRHGNARARGRTVARQLHMERTKCAPWGLNGGRDALPNRLRLERPGAPFSNGNGKMDGVALKPGDVLVVESGGGGGYGDPRDRDRWPSCTTSSAGTCRKKRQFGTTASHQRSCRNLGDSSALL